MLYVTARIDWQLAMVALTISPVLFSVARVYRLRLRKGARGVKALESDALGVVQEVLSVLRVVKAFGSEDREQARFTDRALDGVRARLRLVRAEEVFGLLVGAITAVGTGAVLLIGAGHVRSGVLTLGDLLLVLGYLAQLYEPLRAMSKQISSVQDSFASAERIFSLLQEAPEVHERAAVRSVTRSHGAIVFDRVSFAYDGRAPTLSDVSFEVNPGSRVGIEGVTGAGKTTLVSLIARFYDPSAGRVLLDGVDVRDYRLEDLRRQVALVLQEPVLFATSIAENIAYARPEATGRDIVAAARAACAHDFITALPDGYDTVVGERGVRLSGGERQRLSLARAFLKDAPILILDEPTSALDAGTESQLVEVQERVMEGRTSFIVAHRPRLLEHCDLRLRLEAGRLAPRRDVDLSRAPISTGDVVQSLPLLAETLRDLTRQLAETETRASRAKRDAEHLRRCLAERPLEGDRPERANQRGRGGRLESRPPESARHSVPVSPPPEVLATASRVLASPGDTPEFLGYDPLKRAVHRLHWRVRGRPTSLVVKRLSHRRARVNALVAQCWLPAVGLERVCPRVRGVVPDPGGPAMWQLYEDVGGRELNPDDPDRQQIREVVELIAELHVRFAGHSLLREGRTNGDDFGIAFYASHVARCVRHLRSVDVSTVPHYGELRERLLARMERLYGEREERAALLRDCGGPDTLLHGDLWTSNTLLIGPVDDRRARLIDWDHAGVGPISYDLSTFLYRFVAEVRPEILALYRARLARTGWQLPSDADLNRLFETAECARYACCLAEAALAASRGDAWGFEQMAEIERWFGALEPALVQA
jgi:ABC-type transport system involved in Fe-S cluster assembly fused permease/ATPase subunit/Ser/Thr protein kinase RdoA (MazF antagonist)